MTTIRKYPINANCPENVLSTQPSLTTPKYHERCHCKDALFRATHIQVAVRIKHLPLHLAVAVTRSDGWVGQGTWHSGSEGALSIPTCQGTGGPLSRSKSKTLQIASPLPRWVSQYGILHVVHVFVSRRKRKRLKRTKRRSLCIYMCRPVGRCVDPAPIKTDCLSICQCRPEWFANPLRRGML